MTTSPKSDADHLLMRGKCELVLSNPFLSSILLRLDIRESKEHEYVSTMCTNGFSIVWSRKFAEEKIKNVRQMSGVLAHEVLHVALLHHTRRGHRDPERWNIAGDFAINLILSKQPNLELPGKPATLKQLMEGGTGYLLDPKFENMSTEAIYDALPDSLECSGMMLLGEVNDAKNNMTESERTEAEAQASVLISQAIHAAKLQGRIPAGMEQIIETLLAPKIDWREQLQKFFRKTKISEESWRRPNRRFIHDSVYLPSPVHEPTGTIVICVDTSGSINTSELAEFSNEMKAIHQFVKPERLIVMYCDASVGRIDEFGPQDEFELHPVGGGGTSFIPPFQWLEKHDLVPEAFVYLTDGYGSFPGEQAFPVLWVINNHSVVPPFGEHLTIGE